MKSGFHYGPVKCSQCGRLIAENWLVRHKKSGCQVGSKKYDDSSRGVDKLAAARSWSQAWKERAKAYRGQTNRLMRFTVDLQAMIRDLRFRLYGPDEGHDDIAAIDAIDAAAATGQPIKMPEHTPTYEELQQEIERLRGEVRRLTKAVNDIAIVGACAPLEYESPSLSKTFEIAQTALGEQ